MKKIFLVCMLLVVAGIEVQAQKEQHQEGFHHYYTQIPVYDERQALNPPPAVDYAIGRLIDIHGDLKEMNIAKYASPESGKLISVDATIPFRGKIGHNNQDDIEQLIDEVIKAFAKDEGKAFSSGHRFPKKGNSEYGTTVGPNMDSYRKIIPSDDYEFVFMEIKSTNDPTMRDFFCVCWKKEGAEISGHINMIYSKRPDLIVKEEEMEEQGKGQSVADILTDSNPAKRKLAVLERLSKQYQDEIYRLTKEFNGTPLNNQPLRIELQNQIRDYRSKQNEVLDEMNRIAIGME